MTDDYCIYLDPNRPPSKGVFRIEWQNVTVFNRAHREGWRANLLREVNDWCTLTFGYPWPHEASLRSRWCLHGSSPYGQTGWQVYAPTDAMLFKLAWCNSVSWFTPTHWSPQLQASIEQSWDDHDSESRTQ